MIDAISIRPGPRSTIDRLRRPRVVEGRAPHVGVVERSHLPAAEHSCVHRLGVGAAVDTPLVRPGDAPAPRCFFGWLVHCNRDAKVVQVCAMGFPLVISELVGRLDRVVPVKPLVKVVLARGDGLQS